MARVEKAEPQAVLNVRGQNLIGREAKVVSVGGPKGKIEIDGVQWPVTWEEGTNPETGEWVSITEAFGVNLRAKSIKS